RPAFAAAENKVNSSVTIVWPTGVGWSGDSTRMYVVLLAFGVLATAAGVAMAGFGISINEFSLGNTLLTTGTIAIVGGLILIALATAVQELQRIADALTGRPQPRRVRPPDPFEPTAPGTSRAGP